MSNERGSGPEFEVDMLNKCDDDTSADIYSDLITNEKTILKFNLVIPHTDKDKHTFL